ncbi:hypothetical protein E1B28_007872 [Marasmius oreades]|uniref:Uncharacterized protein n=1 Tax=Marasmius oreades TaxID=181124 RepID=A0A9P7S329_9AGAR|nr:uncharacterized protein E1B28_007872 [Marasmius oreades]KAG7094268.1 hypothetical protein E1B28_007872 [Marasmius oreades]
MLYGQQLAPGCFAPKFGLTGFRIKHEVNTRQNNKREVLAHNAAVPWLVNQTDANILLSLLLFCPLPSYNPRN